VKYELDRTNWSVERFEHLLATFSPKEAGLRLAGSAGATILEPENDGREEDEDEDEDEEEVPEVSDDAAV
jgi:hypothetical protein